MALFTATPDVEFAQAAGLDRGGPSSAVPLEARPDRDKAAQMFD